LSDARGKKRTKPKTNF